MLALVSCDRFTNIVNDSNDSNGLIDYSAIQLRQRYDVIIPSARTIYHDKRLHKSPFV